MAGIVLSSFLLLAGVASQLWQVHRVSQLSKELGDAGIQTPVRE